MPVKSFGTSLEYNEWAYAIFGKLSVNNYLGFPNIITLRVSLSLDSCTPARYVNLDRRLLLLMLTIHGNGINLGYIYPLRKMHVSVQSRT